MISRLDGMGSTDVVEVAGLAPWKDAGPWRVYNLKTGVVPEVDEPTEEQAWGNEIEPFLARWYSKQISRPIQHFPRGSHRLNSRRHDWLWSSPDGLDRRVIGMLEFADDGDRSLYQDKYLEIKNVGSFMAHLWDRSDDDGIPHHVRGQVTIGMYCAEVREWTVVAAIGGLPPRIYHVEYDAELAERLVETGRKFWVDHVCKRVPPAIDASDACRVYLRRKWPRDERPHRESTIAEDELASERIEAARCAKIHASVAKLRDASLFESMGDAKGIRGDGWQLTSWVDAKGTRRTRFTVKGEDDE